MKEHIPVFLASDDRYIAPLSVTLVSIAENSSDKYIYDIRILTDGLTEENVARLRSMELKNMTLEIVNVPGRVEKMRKTFKTRLRDYYSESIFYRLFIPSLYPELSRAIYIDCDVVLVDDIAKLYFTELSDKLLGAVPDESIPDVPEFVKYVKSWVGVDAKEYFNSGVLVMNLSLMREEGIEDAILGAIEKYNFDTVAPDQDYLNFFCCGRVCHLPLRWNKQPKNENPIPTFKLSLIHYNMFNKPWRYRGVLYEEEFWRYAESSPFLDTLRGTLENYTDEQKLDDVMGAVRLIESADALAAAEGGFTTMRIHAEA